MANLEVKTGSVLFFKNFQFHNGEQADKLLIILNDGGNKPYLVLRTTSQPHASRQAKEGCHSEKGYYFIPAGRTWFSKGTWVLLYQPYELDAAKLIKASFEGMAYVTHCLNNELIRAIINCFKKSEDCSGYHLSLID